MADHARLAPSDAPVWAHCAGHIVMCEQLPEPDEWSQPREDGNATHWVADSVQKAAGLIPPEAYLGVEAPNGVIITQEMVDVVNIYTDDIAAINAQFPHAEPMSEVRVTDILNADDLRDVCWGTLDCALACGVTKICFLWDLKFGWAPVKAEMNYQMLCYLLGLVHKIGTEHGINAVPEVFEIRIVQPRPHSPCGDISVWRITYGELMDFTTKLWQSAREAVGLHPKCTAGPWCKDCSGRYGCSALEGVALECMALSEAAVPVLLSSEQLGKQLTEMKYAAEMLKARITGLEMQAMAELKSGTRIPGWELQPGVGNLAWNKPYGEILALGALSGVELAREDTMTPTQAISAGVPETLVRQFSERPARGLKLVKQDHSLARKVFGK